MNQPVTPPGKCQRKITVCLDEQTYQAVQMLAYNEDRQMSEVIRRLIKKEIQKTHK
jgi:predicted CopG family antitoxin